MPDKKPTPGADAVQAIIEAVLGAAGLSGLPAPGVPGNGIDTKASRVGELLAAMGPVGVVKALKGAKAATTAAAPAVKGIKAYHGSPHDFDQFSMAKIGTGEGAQAYGHGLYFAENEGTARSYRDIITGPAVKWKGADARLPPWSKDGSEAIQAVSDAVRANPDADVTSAIQAARAKAPARLRPLIDQLAPDIELSNPGKMYEVNIKADPDQFLDWDAPLSQQQSGAVVKAHGDVRPVRLGNGYYGVTRVLPDGSGTIVKGINEETAEKAVETFQRSFDSMSGSGAYRVLSANVGGQEAGASALKQAGIPGIKYLDQGSRAAGQGSRNYVAFDAAIIDVLRKYGLLPAAVATGAAMEKQK